MALAKINTVQQYELLLQQKYLMSSAKDDEFDAHL